ncbi:formate dehydrogenase subunit delta [Candidatus Methylocalor cossyra]|uniref:NAD-dependent formate dehydrogenase delta subunit n=1 Tax=Candidatus Methylocalor cossyra TaxID=3108543 RepID=A0ABM9NF39_9GAMM
MDTERLVKMANDIGNFFAAEPDRDVAVNGVAEHLKKFWDPRMRRAIIQHLEQGGVGLAELPRAAVALLARESNALQQVGDG